MMRTLLSFLLLISGHMAAARNQSTSFAVIHHHTKVAVLPSMGLTYRYIYDLNGRVMYNRTTTQQLQHLDLSGLPKGYYFIELTGYGQKKVLSLLLQ